MLPCQYKRERSYPCYNKITAFFLAIKVWQKHASKTWVQLLWFWLLFFIGAPSATLLLFYVHMLESQWVPPMFGIKCPKHITVSFVNAIITNYNTVWVDSSSCIYIYSTETGKQRTFWTPKLCFMYVCMHACFSCLAGFFIYKFICIHIKPAFPANFTLTKRFQSAS